MRSNFSLFYKLLLLAGDGLVLLVSFVLAYTIRVKVDPRPLVNQVPALEYLQVVVLLLPLWLIIFSLFGLYTKRVYESRPAELVRLFAGACIGILMFITYDFIAASPLFPARLVPVYAAGLSFGLLVIERYILRLVRLGLYRRGIGLERVILVGNSQTTYHLSEYLNDNLISGYNVVGIVANKQFIAESAKPLHFKTLGRALERTKPTSVIQTDTAEVEKVYDLAINNHLDYRLIPNHTALFTARHTVELLGAFPLINVQTTPLIGNGRIYKRLLDVSTSSLGLLLSLPLTLLIAILMKLSDPRSKVLFKQRRLSRFNKPIYIYKFRTHNRAYNGMLPEEAFAKMGRLDLLKQYREGGDQLADDPRETKIGRLLRRTSLDELPQLINVFKGDISLVGPRALVPHELENYEFKSLILSVKSGLTGLAQISGRKDISFAERRKLDMYYVQNWSIWLDLQIIIRTIYMVLTGKGAK